MFFAITYIIGHYNPSVRIIDLDSDTIYVVCVHFIHKWRDLQFKVYSERQIFFEKLFMAILLLTEFLPEICWEEIASEILFVFCFDVWPGARTLAFRLISQNTLPTRPRQLFAITFLRILWLSQSISILFNLNHLSIFNCVALVPAL